LQRRAGRDSGSLEHQDAEERDQLERDEEKERGREQRCELLLQFREEFAHGEVASRLSDSIGERM
jgi:hypothetical protein